MKLQIFNQVNFLPAIKAFFKDLKVPLNYVADEPTTAKEILKDTYKENDTFQLMDDIYFVGMVDDAAFEGNKSLDVEKIKSDYDGILIFGVTIKKRPNGLLPTRSQLAEISRAFNREFYYTPVVVVFKYGNYLAFANTERLKYKQEWREGEKAGKVSLLRDILIEKPHSGHERILAELQIPTTGTKQVDSFSKLYAYWQEVFSVSLLNKKFYQELSNWYFWATKQVTFPGEPTSADAHLKNAKLEDLVQEHKATNVIRMLTRLLFVWFIKEKKLIPEDLFELSALQNDILNEISPYHETGMFKERNKESIYYKAILQNLFFATLNCPIEGDRLDKRKRGFRTPDSNFGTLFLMRYEKYFKDKTNFLGLVNKRVPFLNGGLFECLDERGEGEKKEERIWIDGFSDNLPKGERLIVPDYLFFGVEEEADLSDIVGISDKKYKHAAVKGLINILKSYKFTITENTPIEEDVALDPELLGKVFENLLASYNPETKTTARKQTGSFYTPREIVNYMVDESLIAYLKNKIQEEKSIYLEMGKKQVNLFGNVGKAGQHSFQADLTGSELKGKEKQLDTLLHELVSFNPGNPFANHPNTTQLIVRHLSNCTILDPACGSGAFPMGILQKMVHILQKLDPENKVWKAVQLSKAEQDSKAAFEIEDKQAREERLLEINEAFDQSINDPDYARKLFLIENCIYGVDIQPIATQISKLRFFISLVVEQKVNAEKDNFGIRPLPNLETKFVAANTLVGVEKPSTQTYLFDSQELKELEVQLKKVRSKLFSARTKDTKLKYRELDKTLREQIANELKGHGWQKASAEKLAGWDPYDQNASSSFFDPEWMFDIQDGFDVVIGNPPYILIQNIPGLIESIKKKYMEYKSAQYKIDLYHLFIEKGIDLLSKTGVISYITPNTFIKNKHNNQLREVIYNNCHLEIVVLFYSQVFENVSVDNLVFVFTKERKNNNSKIFEIRKSINDISEYHKVFDESRIQPPDYVLNFDLNDEKSLIIEKIEANSYPLNHFGRAYFGIQTYDRKLYVSNRKESESWKPVIDGGNVFRYYITKNVDFVHFAPSSIKSGGNPEVYQKNRLVVRQIGKYPEGAYCPKGLYTLNTIYNIFLNNKEISLQFLLAQINSPITKFHWLAQNFDNKETFPKIKKAPLESIPIKISSTHEKLVKVLVLMVNDFPISKLISSLKDIIDSLILDLHFHDHMKESGIDVLEFVERDMKEVMQGREFEKLNDTEKEQAIEQLHAKWSHPDNEVRNRIKLFAVRSPEILKPILES